MFNSNHFTASWFSEEIEASQSKSIRIKLFHLIISQSNLFHLDFTRGALLFDGSSWLSRYDFISILSALRSAPGRAAGPFKSVLNVGDIGQ